MHVTLLMPPGVGPLRMCPSKWQEQTFSTRGNKSLINIHLHTQAKRCKFRQSGDRLLLFLACKISTDLSSFGSQRKRHDLITLVGSSVNCVQLGEILVVFKQN